MMDPQAAVQQIAQLQAAGRAQEAESLCREVLAASPASPLALNAMALLLAGRGALAEAEPLARRAAAAAPREPIFHNNLGNLLIQLGDAAGAESAYHRAVTLKPDFAVACYNLGIARALQGRPEEALAAQRRSIAADPSYWRAQLQIAELLQALGRNQDALDAYAKVITLAPGFVPAHQTYNNLIWSLGGDISELKSFVFARERVGDDPDLLLAEAEMRLRLNQLEPAETLLGRAQQRAPGRADIANARARSLSLLGRTPEAEVLFARAIALQPRVARHHQDFATMMLHANRPAEARGLLQQALELAPLDQSILSCLALAGRQLGDSDLAGLMDMALVREFVLPPPQGFAEIESFNIALAEELARLHTQRVAPMDQTLRGGTQTQGQLFATDSRLVLLLRDSIRAAVADYAAGLPPGPQHPFLSRRSEDFDFAGSWSCRLASGGFHTNHVHPSGWISSAYYVDLPDVVRDGGQGALQFGQSQFLLGEEDQPLRVVTPAVGKLVLFPSYFWHGTIPFESDRSRLTVAFDVVPRAAP